MTICSVHNCTHSRKNDVCILHRFTSNEKICKEWVRLLGDEDLLGLTPQMLYQKRTVCGCHFTDDDYVSFKRKKLKSDAVPSIFATEIIPLNDEQMKSFMPQNNVVESSIAVRVSVDHDDWQNSLNKRKSHAIDTCDLQVAENDTFINDDIEASRTPLNVIQQKSKRRSVDMGTIATSVREATPRRQRTRSSELAFEMLDTNSTVQKVYPFPFNESSNINGLEYVNMQQVVKKKKGISHQALLRRLNGYLKYMETSPAEELVSKIDSLLNNYCKPINFRRVC
ncbi:uncharacterized protein LOC130676011 [Microplitis mediator]|uniref:uncharacterized protein LOC130676005 n=1 Tax=Microplitis mediator TaxID=375433 RepID=UPI0025571C91|nr:uncharacterized protein LOC130676003 isoform X2 [Microplitis mediator]XP_057337935.1 uncharacterized protein LOC130676005 [Microplitis mediator]XP_057337946.1 uncharacterized protein LOC130676011 [Microplitis mediator]